MPRKKWTPQTELTGSLLRSREKRKWQVSYRRYVLDKMPAEFYAPYFGLDIETLRHWFEIQFEDGLGWESFGKAWQFEHIIPTAYFDFEDQQDLLLCWNFINIRVEKLDEEKIRTYRIDQLAAKAYFHKLYEHTGYQMCKAMLDKIGAIERAGAPVSPAIEDFLVTHRSMLTDIAGLNAGEFNSLNQGATVDSILLEREILRKFGSGREG